MYQHYIPKIYIRQVFFILLIGGLLWLLCLQLQFFLPATLAAYAIYIILRQPLFYLTEIKRYPQKVASALLLIGVIITIAIPIHWMAITFNTRIMPLLQHPKEAISYISTAAHALESRFDITLLTEKNLQKIVDWVLHQLQYLFNATLQGLETLLATLVILWFLFTGGKKMEDRFFSWLPLKSENLPYIKGELHHLVFANAIGIPLMGIVQGLVALPAYWLVGVADPWFWFGITFLSGMLPIVGVAFAYIPLSLILLSEGLEIQAWLVFLYGAVIVGSVDNLVRMWLLQKIGHTHPLITLFGVIAGLKMFGLVGFIFGPIMIALVLLLLKIYRKEFST